MKRWSSLVLLLALLGCNGNLLYVPFEEPEPLAVTPPTWEELVNRGIWIVGGQQANYTSPNLVAQIDLFDPITETWYPSVTTLPTPVTFAGVAAHKGKIYVAGGFNATGANTNALQIFDTVTQIWTTGANLPAVRANFDLVPSAGYLYGTAGTTAANYNTAFANASNWVFYNTSTNAWTGPTAFTTFYESGMALLVYGLIHQFGGRSSNTNIASTHFGFIPNAATAGETTTTAEIPIGRVGSAVGFYANSLGTGYILVAGGINANLTGTPTAYIFNGNTANQTILTNLIWYLRAPFEAPAAWVAAGASLPFPVAMIQGAVANNKFYMFGGTKSLPTPNATDESWVLDLKGFPNAPTSIRALPPMPVARFGHKAVMMVQ